MMEPTMDIVDTDYHNIKFYNGIKEINGPYETKVVIKNNKKDLTYFDTQCLIDLLTNDDTDMDYSYGIHTFHGKCGNEQYRLTVNFQQCILEIVNVLVNITSDFTAHTIPSTNYPVYQYTHNPVIVALAGFLIACFTDAEKRHDAYNILVKVDTIMDKLDETENYYLDDVTILLLSIYKQNYFVKQTDVLRKINDCIMETGKKIGDLKIEKLGGNNMYCTNAGRFISVDVRLKDLSRLNKTYIKLEHIIKTLQESDYVLEFKCGGYSYFLIQRGDYIMSFTISSLNTPKCVPIETANTVIYQMISPIWMKLFQDYTEWSDIVTTSYLS